MNLCSKKNYFIVTTLIIITFGFLSCKCQTRPSVNINRLRSDYKKISRNEAKLMIKQKGFFDKYWNKAGGFENSYELIKMNDAKIVKDDATGLVWHQSGSKDFLNLKEAKERINKLNRDEYSGRRNWRLPTLEEALSLMENRKMNGSLYIDPLFDRWQWCILTGDMLDLNKSWLVAFSERVDWFDSNVKINYVRPVCSE